MVSANLGGDWVDELPSKLVELTTFKRNKKITRHCQCYEWPTYPKKSPAFEIDFTNREVICRHCGNTVDTFYAFEILCKQDENREQELEQLYEQAKELYNYKPYLKVIKQLEKECRGGKMILSCPHCSGGILFEEMNNWKSKEMELQRRKFKEK